MPLCLVLLRWTPAKDKITAHSAENYTHVHPLFSNKKTQNTFWCRRNVLDKGLVSFCEMLSIRSLLCVLVEDEGGLKMSFVRRNTENVLNVIFRLKYLFF